MTADPENAAAPSEAVCVAVHVRPLIEQERDQMCGEVLDVTPGVPQVRSGTQSFTFDNVFGGDCGADPSTLYPTCVEPLVDGLFKGYNATVFAYGQTGSGKTYTMGSAFPQNLNSQHKGVIPLAMESIFARITSLKDVAVSVRVGFVEIHKEEIRDLITPKQAKSVHIRELPGGGIVLAGADEKEVTTREEMIAILERGTALRATGETGMNKRSSRSHAIFTITVEQRKLDPQTAERPSTPTSSNDSDAEETPVVDDVDAYLCAKMHLVDLAGSERAKRTKAQGQRLQEGININKGLLALGNVINALAEGKPHVPYRDSKLTRMLQDSLGGNSRTLMVACVSPADINMEESVNTLRYAARARAIKNKPVVNRDPIAAQVAALRQQLAAAKAENLDLRKRLGLAPMDEVDDLTQRGNDSDLAQALAAALARIAALEAELARVRAECEELRQELRAALEAQLVTAMQRDKVAHALEVAAGSEVMLAALEDAKVPPGQETVERALATKVQELEDEIRQLRLAGMSGTPSGSPFHNSPLSPFSPTFAHGDGDGFDAEELAHRAEMARVQSQMDQLQSQLENKEAAIAAVSGHAAMRAALESQLKDIAAERDSLAKERSDLLSKIHALQTASTEERTKLERMYRERIKELDARAKAAEKKERKVRELEATRSRAMDTVNRLEGEIQAIRAQKAALQRQTERTAKEFAAWRKEREREVMQLKKAGRQNAAQISRMEALQAKQQDVLRRKTEEAAAARKRLQLLEGRRGRGTSATSAGSRPATSTGRTPSAPMEPAILGGAEVFATAEANDTAASGADAAAGPTSGAPWFMDEASRRDWVEAELDSCCSSYELRRVLEGEKALRSEAAKQLREVERRLAALKNPQWWGAAGAQSASKYGEEALLKKKARLIEAADKHSRQIQEVQLALVQARAQEEERGEGAADARRWAPLRVAPEARSMLTTVFRCASQYKAQGYEAQLAMTELSEEVEMLRLRLEVAEAEKLEAVMRLETQSHAVPGGQAATPVKPDATDAEAASLLQELDSLSGDGPNRRSTLPANGTAGEDGEGDEEESDDEDDWEESEEDEESDDEDEVADTWDPSQATPLNGKGRKRRPASAGDAGRRAVLSEADRHVLEHMNAARAEQGQEPLAKLTIAELRQALKGKIIGGQEWVAGKKKKNELVGEYLQMLLDETPGVAEEPRAALEAPPESLKMESPAAASAGAGDQPPGSSNGRKSPFNQLRGAFRRSMRSESSGEVSKTPSRSGSLRSFAARALGQSSRLSSGSAEVSSSAPAPPDGTAYVHSRGSMDDAVAAEDGDTIVVDMQSMVRTSTEEEGKHSGGGGVRPTTSSGSANSGASAKSGAAKRKVWIPG